jgi:hypothetical protein
MSNPGRLLRLVTAKLEQVLASVTGCIALRRALRPQLTAAQLAEHLRADPSLVEQWERYSEDKRTSGGWSFVRFPGGWALGRLNSDGAGAEERLTQADDAEACAEYILLELDWLAAIRARKASSP